MALEYITDNDAVNGVVNTGSIDITGRKLKLNAMGNIGLLINAPKSHVIIGKMMIEQVRKGLVIRAARSVTIDEVTIEEFWNDALQILASNVTISNFTGISTIRKVYDNTNHSDFIQIFNHLLQMVHDVRINNIDLFSRNHPEQANIHLTELHRYFKMFFGRESFKINSTAAYPYAVSAINLSESIIGGDNNEIGEFGIRLEDVKSHKMVSRNNHIIDIPERKIEVARGSNYTIHERAKVKVPKRKYVPNAITEAVLMEQARLAIQQKW